MNTTVIITEIIKAILGMKFGWLLLLVVGIVMGLSLIKNMFSGAFNVAKFAGGFNIFNGSVQGKLLYYGLIIFGCFVVYSFIMRPTTSFDTDYRNNVHHNRDVYLDQRVGDVCSEKCAIAIQPFGFTILKLGCVKSCEASITQQTKVEKETPKLAITGIEISNVKPIEVKKLNPLSAPFRWISKLFTKGKA